MKIITNEDRITRGARIGKVATLVGLGFLVAGLIVSLLMQDSPLLWLSFGCLLLGLIVSSVGTMNMNRWVREPRADQALTQALKGFDDRYRLYNYVLPAPHVLLGPVGLYVLTALGQDGVIRYDGDRFRRDFSFGRVLRFMAEEGLGKPFAEADAQVKALQGLLDEHDVAEEPEIQNVLVFYNPRAELLVQDPPRPVIVPKALKKLIRKGPGEKLSQEQYDELLALFEDEEDSADEAEG
jgi:hypothetical protein